MPKQTSLFLTQNIANSGTSFTNGDSGEKNIALAGNNDSIVKSVNVHSTDSAAIMMTFSIYAITGNNLGATYPFLTTTIPASAGSGSIAAIDILSVTGMPSLPYDNAGKRYYPLASGCALKAKCETSPTAGKTISVTSIIENY